jgi:hypothetical protein
MVSLRMQFRVYSSIKLCPEHLVVRAPLVCEASTLNHLPAFLWSSTNRKIIPLSPRKPHRLRRPSVSFHKHRETVVQYHEGFLDPGTARNSAHYGHVLWFPSQPAARW